MKMKVFVGAMLLTSVCLSDDNVPFQLEPLPVSQVLESTALGYGNGRKLISDPDGRMYFSAVSKAPNGAPGVCVIRTVRKNSGATPTFETVWIENTNGKYLSANMHFASSLGAYGAGPFYVVWTGGDAAKFNDPKLAHQLRFATITTGETMKVEAIGQPFTVTGFNEAYRPPYLNNQYWQEFPSAFVSKDGKLHVVWEGRDSKRTNSKGVPIPAIAYAVRDADGTWSVKGNIAAPPYLDVKSIPGGQYRPFMAAGADGSLHVLCYGLVNNKVQILYGRMNQETFSGWAPIAPSLGDQRHVSAAIDGSGRIHATWRESGRDNEPSFIAYSMCDLDGKWTAATRVDDPYRSGSTPNITVDDNAAYIVWTGWTEGFENSDSQKNNGFPNDNDTVEGRLEFATKRFDSDQFSTPVFLAGGTGSYPRIARVRNSNPPKLAVIWALGTECLPQSCIQIFFGELTPPAK